MSEEEKKQEVPFIKENFNSLWESNSGVIKNLNMVIENQRILIENQKKLIETVKSIDEKQEEIRQYVVESDRRFIKLQNHLVDIGVIIPKVEGDANEE